MFYGIVAINKKNAIGLNKKMMWYVPEDLSHFRNKTLHQNVVMGRITYENLPKHLENRNIYVVSRGREFEQCTMIRDFDEFLKEHNDSQEVFYIAGGARIYNQAFPYMKKIYVSIINDEQEGDAYFPVQELKDFTLVNEIQKDTFTLKIYERSIG